MSNPLILVMVVTACSLFPAASTAANRPAVLSQVEGRVQRIDTSQPTSAVVLQPLAPTARLRLEDQATAVLICDDDRARRLTGPGEVTMDCSGGEALSSGTYARLVPKTGRVKDFHDSLLSEAPSRNDADAGKTPDLISPSSPDRSAVVVLEDRPEIQWVEVKDALKYTLVLERDGKEQAWPIAASDCRPDPRTAPFRTCRHPWPGAPLGTEAVRLQVIAKTSDPDWTLRRGTAAFIQHIGPTARRGVESELAALPSEGTLPAATVALLEAEVLARAKLFNESAAALERYQSGRPEAAVAVRLGNLYLGLAALRPALASFRKAETLLPPRGGDRHSRADMELGLGRLHARRADTASAVHHLGLAVKELRRLGRDEEADAAAAELERARRSL